MLPTSGHVGSHCWHLCINDVAASQFVGHRTRTRIYRRLGLGKSHSAHGIGAGCYFHSCEISICDRTFINDFCCFESIAPSQIGNNVAIGMQTAVATSTHEPGSASSRGAWGVLPRHDPGQMLDRDPRADPDRRDRWGGHGCRPREACDMGLGAKSCLWRRSGSGGTKLDD